jgi:hypothetical protein
VIDLRAVLHEEAADARELVLLRRKDDDIELELRQIRPGQFEARGVVGVLDVDRSGGAVRDALLEGLDRLTFVLVLAGCVVVRCHA